MLGLALKDKHSDGEHRLEIWRDEHGSIAISVYDVAGGPQFDFSLSDLEVNDFIHLMERSIGQSPGEAV